MRKWFHEEDIEHAWWWKLLSVQTWVNTSTNTGINISTNTGINNGAISYLQISNISNQLRPKKACQGVQLVMATKLGASRRREMGIGGIAQRMTMHATFPSGTVAKCTTTALVTVAPARHGAKRLVGVRRVVPALMASRIERFRVQHPLPHQRLHLCQQAALPHGLTRASLTPMAA
mmetsp:Transcript_16668/g.29694  ORF Transcript_16668/g.29694 Transcript_16668/m.29694 type:complete len:176 (-) Transcript_16668:353-880(-)